MWMQACRMWGTVDIFRTCCRTSNGGMYVASTSGEHTGRSGSQIILEAVNCKQKCGLWFDSVLNKTHRLHVKNIKMNKNNKSHKLYSTSRGKKCHYNLPFITGTTAFHLQVRKDYLRKVWSHLTGTMETWGRPGTSRRPCCWCLLGTRSCCWCCRQSLWWRRMAESWWTKRKWEV